MNASVINACYSQHNGVTESTKYSADLSEETQSLRRKQRLCSHRQLSLLSKLLEMVYEDLQIA